MVPQQFANRTHHNLQGQHSRDLSTDSQEVAMRPHSCSAKVSSQAADAIMLPLVRRMSQLSAEDDDDTKLRLPSLEGCFQCNDHDDDHSLDSQVKLVDDTMVHENDSDDSDDDDSIMSQIRVLSALETAAFQDAETIVHDNVVPDEDSDDDSLSSIVSKAYSVTSSSSASCCSYSASSCDDMMVPAGTKRVVFVRQHNEIHTIPNREDFSLEEIGTVWYKPEEMAAMVVARYKEDARAKRAAKMQEQGPLPMVMDHILPSEESSSSSSTTNTRSTSLPLTLMACLPAEGLLRESCKPDDEASEARIHTLVDAVMDEQEVQWDADIDDADTLAQASYAHSRACTIDAIQRAQLDALEAIPFYLGDDSSTENDLLDHSMRSETGHCRKIQEEVYQLSPMVVSPKAKSIKKKHRARKNSAVVESRWSPASPKRTWSGLKGKEQQEGGTNQMQNGRWSPVNTAKRTLTSLPMPLRITSDHGPEQQQQQQENNSNRSHDRSLSMPMRIASNHGSGEMSDILSVVSSGSIDSESEFGAIEYEERLAPPTTVSVQKKKTRKTKIFSKKDSSSTTGIYQKVKRKLQDSKKKNKRKKKAKSTKTDKKKVKGMKKAIAIITKMEPSQSSGLSDEFAEMDTSEVKRTLVAL
ncbi:unnamed protein product [Cylindrotheca closterium]|uniref:Uncharacterized protein n=1 Tax=Cylindrotheca closterium TaxID=2856 RepID=A0AAD2CH38_9STRA|nr:unnamed protein product [Cylindrotheca closterium]